MRSLTGAFAAALMLSTVVSTSALAAEAEGKIKAVDRDNLTITLENGTSFKLPGEFDVEAVKEGMQVLLAYDKIGDQNMITDMELSE
jgi:Cu/Ag efflux protein CusF